MLKIYRIVDNTNGNIYIGQTKQKYLCQRLAEHRSDPIKIVLQEKYLKTEIIGWS
jgi:predicted GIY-YIG superfamily endonuclease